MRKAARRRLTAGAGRGGGGAAPGARACGLRRRGALTRGRAGRNLPDPERQREDSGGREGRLTPSLRRRGSRSLDTLADSPLPTSWIEMSTRLVQA